ncbi:MAG TPA: alpha-1,4-glucan--maltose-1-phosphate maltosyltransferase [Ferrovibrio sp.]|uniref:alpha-1,4-glucan--maltose-1-phosphate maltosyltransferase n=1 Tax=Ferrovibrio sp. TaxID=1917215 RepID=UPI002B4B6964|nr:alpha-1,4-glucan--maltose-1-phosphate maltosyltransferase [Ferrovibrio sp.]HLT77828.1 alpha-1,4-glucan--maltose-1-phosphate maltosyltransferase [Ferrovibrio sp.]
MNLQRRYSSTEKKPVSPVPVSAPQYVIEDVYPVINGGRFPAKRIAGEAVGVWADIFRDGTEVTLASLVWRREGGAASQSTPMLHHENDRWHGRFVPPEPGRYSFHIEAWSDPFATWQRDLRRRIEAGQDVSVELDEGRLMLAEAGVRPPEQDAPDAWLAPELGEAMQRAQPRGNLVTSPVFPLMVERVRARAGAWYEIMARSQGQVPGRSATFDDCIARLPDIAAMGFDVLYLLPIHPIGRTARKGRNNSLTSEPGDPGSPYAIGSAEGGHDAIHPELGTLDDFRRLVSACREHGMEVALDFAVQCSPDHPWLREHPEWFRHRPDGSIRYAENPPKKYEDIVNVDFHCKDAAGLWMALRDIVLFWVRQGVRIFRVDNPHTKPFPFWEWMIAEVQREDPGVIFLSEAFTRPKVMKALAKFGFSQSYTYFTWRTHKAELSEYISELTSFPTREFFRPNFFVTTPDILPWHLQGGEPWAFKARFALAATLSSTYGIYNGFELLEHEPIPGKEEYLNSEKYEYRTRDWNRPGNIKPFIARLNRIRRENPALLQTNNLRLAQVDHDRVMGFVKDSVDGSNAVAVAISVEGSEPKEFWFHFGGIDIGPVGNRKPVTAIENLVTGARHTLEWGGIRLRIDPTDDPMLIFRCLS